MHKFITILCFSLFALSMHAAPINGIRIESDGSDIIVFIDGKQICNPTGSCFIANLNSGHYQIEVYAAHSSNRRGPGKRGELLYKERFYYNSSTMKDISVSNNRPHHVNRDRTMPPDTFTQFIHLLKEESFDDDKNKQVEMVLMTSDFTSEQCLTMIKLYGNENEKVKLLQLIYPQIIDKQNFFQTIETLAFKSDKDKMNKFVRQYHQDK